MKTPRKHQSRAIRAVLKALRQRSRTQCIMACGTGKTFVGLRVHENLKSNLTVVFVPTLQLVAQLKREWETDRRRGFTSFVVCSDSTVVDGATIKASDLGLKATTDRGKIAEFMLRSGPKVIFCTYQSSERVAEAQAISGAMIDLVVCDEAHRTTGIDGKGYFQVPLDEDLITAKKRLFMTATPRLVSDRMRTKAEKEGIELVGMDDEAVYGPVAFRYTYPEAIADKVLCDYRILFVAVTDGEVEQAIADHSFLTHEHRQMLVEDVAKHVGLGKAMKEHGLRRVLAFVNRIKTAADYGNDALTRGFTRTMRATKVLSPRTLWTDHVEGSMSMAQRDVRLGVLVNPREDLRRVLYSARCLTEGIDLPAVDAVAILDPRKSVIDAHQTTGRSVRLPFDWSPTPEKPDPPLSYIIVPFLVRDADDAKSLRKTDAFDRMVQILRALKEHDSRLEAWLEHLAHGDPGTSDPDGGSLVELGDVTDLRLRDVVGSVVLEAAARSHDRTTESARREIQRFFDEHGRRPYDRDLNATGLWLRSRGMSLRTVCDEMGLPGGRVFDRTMEEARREIQRFFDEHGCRPRYKEPKMTAITPFLRGKGTSLQTVCNEMGLPGGRILDRTMESARREIQQFFDEHGKRPTQQTHAGLNSWLFSQQGTTVSKVCDEMGFPGGRKSPTGSVRDSQEWSLQACREELRGFFKEHGRRPFIKEAGGMDGALRRRFGTSMHGLCDELGLSGGLRTLKKARRELQQLFDEYGRRPTYEEAGTLPPFLAKRGTTLHALCDDMGFPGGVVRDHGRTLATARREIQDYFDEHGRRPRQKEGKFNSLDQWLFRHGTSIPKLCDEMGLPGGLRSLEKARREIQAFFKEHGRYPTSKDLRLLHRWLKKDPSRPSLEDLCDELGLLKRKQRA